MQVAMTNALNMLRATPSQQGMTTSTAASSDPRTRLLQRANEALDDLQRTSKSSADAARERAARKLAELQQQVEMLKSGGLSPEAAARLAAELSQKIAGVAAQFASAIAGATAGAAAPVAAEAGAAAAASDTASVAHEAKTDETATDPAIGKDEPVDAAEARKAYEETSADGEQQASGISKEDRDILEKLKSLLRDVRQALEKAMRELRNGKNDQAYAAPPMAMPTASAATPVSFTV